MKAVIDRIEGTMAILIVLEEKSVRLEIPSLLLPPGCREGDILTIGIELDIRSTDAAKTHVSDLIDKLKKLK